MNEYEIINVLQDYLEEQETRIGGHLPNACRSKEPTLAYPRNPHQIPIYTSPSNQETNEIQGLEAFANPDIAYDSSLLFQSPSETEIAVLDEDLTLVEPTLQVSPENNETYSIDDASLVPNPPNRTLTAPRRNSDRDPIICPRCDKPFMHRYKYK